jgi:signal transduction histidine kinase
MEEEIKMENKKIFQERPFFGWPSMLILFLGILSLNFIVFQSFLMVNGSNALLIASLALSLILVFFIIYKNRKIIEETSQEKQGVLNNSSEEMKQNTEIDLGDENEFNALKEKLIETTKEYAMTTKRLFEREMELKKANQRLREIDSVKSEFVATAAHQLRTPLTGIKWSYTTLLENDTGPLNDLQKQIVEKGFETIDYAISVINDLLNTARLEEGKTGFTFTEQPIGPIIQDVLTQHQETIKEKKINLVIDTPLDSPFAFKFDKERMSIVFDNLLANAIKYTKPGGEISIKSFRNEREIQFKIADSGIGIPQKDFNKVFTKFFRAKNAIGYETSGSGLGLYVVKNIVEKHGGRIHVDSEENKGTTFTITLPLS